jgi:hypothetical protein
MCPNDRKACKNVPKWPKTMPKIWSHMLGLTFFLFLFENWKKENVFVLFQKVTEERKNIKILKRFRTNVLAYRLALPFCQLAFMSIFHFINLPYHQLSISSTCHFINLPFHELAMSSACHFINLPFHQLAISSTCNFINLPFHQLAISSTCHFINLQFHQLAI